MNDELLKAAIRDIPDFPKPGIIFKDLTPIFHDPNLLKLAVQTLCARHATSRPSIIAGIEARGFILGAAMALEMGLGFVPIRKKGKLPYKTIETSYDLEYGSATIEVHTDAFAPGMNVLLVDDLLATGGTAAAAASLVEKAGGHVCAIDFLVELSFLQGRQKLTGYDLFAPIVF